MRVDATIKGHYGLALFNLFLGNVTEAFSQAGMFELAYELASETYQGRPFEEKSDTINSYKNTDGVCRAVSHFCEYIPVGNISNFCKHIRLGNQISLSSLTLPYLKCLCVPRS